MRQLGSLADFRGMALKVKAELLPRNCKQDQLETSEGSQVPRSQNVGSLDYSKISSIRSLYSFILDSVVLFWGTRAKANTIPL